MFDHALKPSRVWTANPARAWRWATYLSPLEIPTIGYATTRSQTCGAYHLCVTHCSPSDNC
eukprot:2029168-Pleurochrysis_carterae.AAC.1